MYVDIWRGGALKTCDFYVVSYVACCFTSTETIRTIRAYYHSSSLFLSAVCVCEAPGLFFLNFRGILLKLALRTENVSPVHRAKTSYGIHSKHTRQLKAKNE